MNIFSQQPQNHKAKRLILHFGLAKTGTSSLQRALFNHRKKLLKNNSVLYPGNHENHFFLQAMCSNSPESLYQIQALNLKNRDELVDFIANYRRNFLAEINEKKPQRIIISSEYFSSMDNDELHTMRLFLESIADNITLFAYVRDPWGFSVSWIQEMIRMGVLSKEVEFSYLMSNIEIIDKFEKAFELRAQVVPFVHGSGDFDSVKDFIHRFGLSCLETDGVLTHSKANIGMHREAACVMLLKNQMYPVYDQNNNLISDFARDWMTDALMNAPYTGTPIQLSKSTVEKIYKDSKNDIKQLKRKYFPLNDVMNKQNVQISATNSDTLSVSILDAERVSEYLLSCMHTLAETAILHHVERIFWNGKYLAAIGNLIAARDCFNQVISIDPQHKGAIQAIELLDAS